jgi:hypothetical protein
MFDQKELIKKYANLRIYSQIEYIGQKHGLHIDQIGLLDSETKAMIVGVTPREKFIAEVMDGLGVSLGKAEAIAQDVNSNIMIPLRESLKNPTGPTEVPPQAPLEEIPHPAVAIHELENPTSTTSANILNRSLEQKLLSESSSTPSTHEITVIKTSASNSQQPSAPSKIPVPLPPSQASRPMTPRPPVPPKPPQKSYTADPYREAVK